MGARGGWRLSATQPDPLRAAPGASYRARLHGGGTGGLRAVHRVHDPGPTPGSPGTDCSVTSRLRRSTPITTSSPVAHGPVTNVEPGRRSLLLRRTPRARLCAAASGVHGASGDRGAPWPLSRHSPRSRRSGSLSSTTTELLPNSAGMWLPAHIACFAGGMALAVLESTGCPVPRHCCDWPGERSLPCRLHTRRRRHPRIRIPRLRR